MWKTMCCVGLSFGIAAFVGILLCVSDEAHAQERTAKMIEITADGALGIVLGNKASIPEKRVVEILIEEVAFRTGIKLKVGTDAPYRLVVGTSEANDEVKAYCKRNPDVAILGNDGFHIGVFPDKKELYVVGQSPSGVVAGIGKLLRLMHYAGKKLSIPVMKMNDAPKMPIRGTYLWTMTHGKDYLSAPVECMERYIEDLALWGCNDFAVWFAAYRFKSEDDPKALKMLKRLKHYGDTAHRIGMKFTLTLIHNGGYADKPKEIANTKGFGTSSMVCPSKPGGMEYLKKWQEKVIAQFPAIDTLWSWPRDPGGCMCEACNQSGPSGYLKASEQLEKIYHARFPEGKLWLSIWHLPSSDHQGIIRYLEEKKPDWLAGIICGIAPRHGSANLGKPSQIYSDKFRIWLSVFPEISMAPRGPFEIEYFEETRDQLLRYNYEDLLGGWPYLERLSTDFANTLWLNWLWDPDRKTNDILEEYLAHYIGHEHAAEGAALIHVMRNNPPTRKRLPVPMDDLKAAWEKAVAIDAKLQPWGRKSWRWGQIFGRAAYQYTRLCKGEASLPPEQLKAIKKKTASRADLFSKKRE